MARLRALMVGVVLMAAATLRVGAVERAGVDQPHAADAEVGGSVRVAEEDVASRGARRDSRTSVDSRMSVDSAVLGHGK